MTQNGAANLVDPAVLGQIARRLGQVGYVLTHPVAHLQLVALLQRAQSRGLLVSQSKVAWKYLGAYLLDHLPAAARRSAIRHHYAFLLHRRHELALDRWARGMTLWERQAETHHYGVVLGQSTFSKMEGESQITFFIDGVRLFTLTFSILPSATLGLGDGHTLFIGGFQGGYASRERIRIAARDNGEASPQAFLMLAAHTVAETLALDHVVAAASSRLAARWHADGSIPADYDTYWTTLGATRTDSGLYVLPSAAERAAEDRPAQGHRSRARRRRRHKEALRAVMQQSLAATLRTPR